MAFPMARSTIVTLNTGSPKKFGHISNNHIEITTADEQMFRCCFKDN